MDIKFYSTVMVESIFIYVCFALIMYTLGRNEWIVSKHSLHSTGQIKVKWTANSYIMMMFFIIMCGMRYRVGVDCEAYVDMLKQGQSNYHYDRLEPLFRCIVDALRATVPSRFLYLGLLASLQIIPFYYALRKRKYLYPYIGIILIMGPFFLIWMNGIRQSIAACFFVLASVCLVDGEKKERLMAALIILLAAQIHKSAYILLVFVFLPIKWDLFKNKYINIAILIVCAVLGQTDFLRGILGGYTDIELGVLYSNYNLELTIAQDSYMPYGPRRIVLLLLSIMTIWFAPEMKKSIKDGFLVYSFNLFFIHACLCDNLFSNVSFIFRRPFFYTYPFEMICFAYLLYYLKQRYKSNSIIYLSSIGLSCLFILIECYASASVSEETSLFKFFFLQ